MRASVNELRRMLEAGQITEADLAGMTLSGKIGPSTAAPSAPALALSEQEAFAAGGEQGPLPMGSMRNEATGAVTYFRPGGGGFSDKPYPQGQQGGQGRTMRVVGADGRSTYDLGEEPERALPIDYTRPPVEIAGVGRGHYTADGRSAVVVGPDGSKTRVVLGYDRAASRKATAEDLAIAQARAALEHSAESTGLLRDKREALATQMKLAQAAPVASDAGGMVPQAVLEKMHGRAPEGMRWNTSGTLEPIPGFEKPMTESQAKALAFGTRMAEASEILDVVGQKGKIQPSRVKQAVEGVPLVGGALAMGANFIASDEQQQVEQAERNFINAVLRRESGAVISPGEFANARVQYFPQPGDSAVMVEQKRRNRQAAIAAMGEEVGSRRRLIDAAAAGGREFTQGGGAPPRESRVIGQAYDTPRGKLIWLGNGWRAP